MSAQLPADKEGNFTVGAGVSPEPFAPRTYQSAWQWNADGSARLMTAEEWLEEEADVHAAAELPEDEGPSTAGIMRAIAREIATLRREKTQWADAATLLASGLPNAATPPASED